MLRCSKEVGDHQKKTGLDRKAYGCEPGKRVLHLALPQSPKATLRTPHMPEAADAALALPSKSSWRPAPWLGALGCCSSSPGGHPMLAAISETQVMIFCFIPHLGWNLFPGRRAARINSLPSVKYRYYCTKCIAKAQEMIVNYIFSAGL